MIDFSSVKDTVKQLGEYAAYSSLVAFAGLLVNPMWSKNPRIVLAAVLFTVVLAAAIDVFFGVRWVLIGIIIGTLVAPNLILLLQSEETLDLMIEKVLERLKNRK